MSKGELIGKRIYGRVYLALNATTGDLIALKQVELLQTASDNLKNDSRQHTVMQALHTESEIFVILTILTSYTIPFLNIFLESVPRLAVVCINTANSRIT
jgi:mitogen-activated protein kinase kinase kinase